MIGVAPSNYPCGGAQPATPTPTAPREGVPVDIDVPFDGWGYAHLYRDGSGKLDRGRPPYVIPEGLDERYANDFGDLSIHEFATDPRSEPRVRVVLLGRPAGRSASARQGMQEVGRYIDADGNNFWGIEQFTTAAASG